MIKEVAGHRKRLDKIHANYRERAEKLLHYLALRRRDRRHLQLCLAELGLSSLGRAESHVLDTVDAVLEILHRLTGTARKSQEKGAVVVDLAGGAQLLAGNTERLLGEAVHGRGIRIMVTRPSEAAKDFDLVYNLLQQGMDCMRINCAHDNATAWLRIIEHLRQAELSLGRSCRVVMDLAGPKLRTGLIKPGPAVIRIRPQRDVHGWVTAPARVWLTGESAPCPSPSPADASLPVPATWLASLHLGQRVTFTDARDARRALFIVDVTDQGCWGGQ